MLGKPKYKVNDIVKFEVDNTLKTGIVAIVDAYGTFFDKSDASYDIFVREENMLYKHFTEHYILEKVGEFEENVWNYL